jgi:hypothetical protein
MTDKLAMAAAQGESAGFLESDLGSASSEIIGTPATALGQTDLGSNLPQANATGDDGSSGPASLAGTTVPMGAAGGLVFNITYDSSVSSAPAGFTAAIADVVNYYTSVFSDPITINIDVGWGEVAGQALASGALGESETNLGLFSYSQVKTALTADAKSADDASAVRSLPGTDPTSGGSFVLATAEAKSLGLGTNGAVDGYVGFSSSASYTFDPNNRAVAGVYDFIGAAEHEISEVMGRIALLGTPLSGLSHTYTALDLFRYAGPGSQQLAAGHPAYFSVDGGNTGLNNFNTAANGDAGDWASGGGSDSYNAFVSSGVAEPVTANDLRVMDAIGWDLGTAKIDTPPVVTPIGSNITASPGQIFDVSSLFTASDPDGDAIAQYDFWDTGGGGGYFLVNGAAQSANGDIYVSAAQLSQTAYQAGTGTDTLWVRAYDGTQWSAWSPSFTVSAQSIDTPPVVTPTSPNVAASPGQVFDAASLFTASDPDGDAITQYDFWDTGGGGGYFLINGAAQSANGDIYVSAAQLAQTAYQSGSGTDTLWVRANDGTQWSAWSPSFTVTSEASMNVASIVSSDLTSAQAGPIILTVGPNGQYQTISDAVAFADADTNSNDSFDIQVTPGTYTNDFPEVTRPVTIEVDPNATGPVVLLATEPLPNKKGIILTTSSLTVRGLTFEGATISNADGGNGAGIRDQNVDGSNPPASLIVENSTFIGNQEGILTGYDASETISIVNSTFANNGNPDPNYFQHALYVNDAGSLTVTGSLFGGQLIGHDIKSRAMVTTITNSRIYDGAPDPADGIGAGSTSYGIDTPNGGVVTISGNLIVQGPASENSTMVDYGTEGLVYSSNSLTVSNNTFISTGLSHAIGIYDAFATPVQLNNNTFQGVETPVYPASAVINSPTDTPPVVVPASLNITASPGQIFDVSSLFTASDPDGDAITQYDFWDTGGGGGYFLVNGAAQSANGDIYVSAAQLSQTAYQAGNGTDMLWVRAYDGRQWSAWSPGFTVSAQSIDTPPVVTPTSSNVAASPGQIFDAASLFTASDPDGDAITQYDFWDTGGGSGYFLVNGAAQSANGDIYVSAAQLPQTAYQAGNGTDTLWVRAYDGTQWGAWSPSFSVTGLGTDQVLGTAENPTTLLTHS